MSTDNKVTIIFKEVGVFMESPQLFQVCDRGCLYASTADQLNRRVELLFPALD
jgi:hypothetical protein